MDSILSETLESMDVEGNPGRLDEVRTALKGPNILANILASLSSVAPSGRQSAASISPLLNQGISAKSNPSLSRIAANSLRAWSTSHLFDRHFDGGADAQPGRPSGKTAIIEAEQFIAMTAGPQVQGVGKVHALAMPDQRIRHSRPVFDADVGKTQQMFDDADKVGSGKAIERPQDPFQFQHHRQGNKEMGQGNRAMGGIDRRGMVR